jgi:hypothetical protein
LIRCTQKLLTEINSFLDKFEKNLVKGGMKKKILSLSVAAVFALSSFSRADLIDIEAQWSGASFANGASAVATFTLDTSLLNNPGFSSFSGAGLASAFQNFQLTVSGASAGNGVFALPEFSMIFMNTSGGTLDFHSELIGQATAIGVWGPSSPSLPLGSGDFNFFSNGLSALTPSGSSIFTLLTGGGERIVLTSFAPVAAAPVASVPETSTWVMGFLALGAVVFMARRRRLSN